MKYQVEYRKGHKGVCSRDDWTREYEADDIEDLKCDLISDGYDIVSVSYLPTIETPDKQYLLTCGDDNNNWEHYFIITELGRN